MQPVNEVFRLVIVKQTRAAQYVSQFLWGFLEFSAMDSPRGRYGSDLSCGAQASGLRGRRLFYRSTLSLMHIISCPLESTKFEWLSRVPGKGSAGISKGNVHAT